MEFPEEDSVVNKESSAAVEMTPAFPVWDAVWSESHNSYYYHNVVTDEVTWTRPIGLDEKNVVKTKFERKPIVSYALCDFQGRSGDEISFKNGDQVILLRTSMLKEWWYGASGGKMGLFPCNTITVPDMISVPVMYGKAVVTWGGEDPDDLPIKKGEIVAVMEAVENEEWWWCEHNGEEGSVPRAFIAPVDGHYTYSSPILILATSKNRRPSIQGTVVRALHNFPGEQSGDLTFKIGEKIKLMDFPRCNEWWFGEIDERRGMFPKAFVEQPVFEYVNKEPILYAVAIHDITAEMPGDLEAKAGQAVIVLEAPPHNDWWFGEVEGRQGTFPRQYVEPAKTEFPPKQRPMNGARARALFDFPGDEENDLPFLKGDIITIVDILHDIEWWEGERDGVLGSFPKGYVEILPPTAASTAIAATVAASRTFAARAAAKQAAAIEAATSMGKQVAIAVRDFEIEHKEDLGFARGDVIILLDTPDDSQWWQGELDGKQGSFPKSHVKEPAVAADKPMGRAAVALFDFKQKGEGNLQLLEGDRIELLDAPEDQQVWTGRREDGQEGRFPKDFVKEILHSTKEPPPPPKSPPPEDAIGLPGTTVTALHDYGGHHPGDLKFGVGDKITIVNADDEHWFIGEINGKKGHFPKDFVDTSSLDLDLVTSVPIQQQTIIQPIVKKEAEPEFVARPASPEVFAKVVRNFGSGHPKELQLTVGQKVRLLHRPAYEPWWYGEMEGKRGMFRKDFVELLDGAEAEDTGVPVQELPMPVFYATAIHDCKADLEGDLTFMSGDVITVLDAPRNEDWWYGELEGRRGAFPKNYVERQRPVEVVQHSEPGDNSGLKPREPRAKPELGRSKMTSIRIAPEPEHAPPLRPVYAYKRPKHSTDLLFDMTYRKTAFNIKPKMQPLEYLHSFTHRRAAPTPPPDNVPTIADVVAFIKTDKFAELDMSKPFTEVLKLAQPELILCDEKSEGTEVFSEQLTEALVSVKEEPEKETETEITPFVNNESDEESLHESEEVIIKDIPATPLEHIPLNLTEEPQISAVPEVYNKISIFKPNARQEKVYRITAPPAKVEESVQEKQEVLEVEEVEPSFSADISAALDLLRSLPRCTTLTNRKFRYRRTQETAATEKVGNEDPNAVTAGERIVA